MDEPAREVAVLFRPGDLPRVREGFAETLASHLVGRRVERGLRVALPGWPPLTVERVDPSSAIVQPGTEVEITVPPGPSEGPVNLAILVDASLTMGQGGSPTSYERAAGLIDAFLMNGRSFLASAGVVVQGGRTRHVEELAPPEEISGALIHKVDPKGTFDLEAGLERSLELLEDASEGSRAVLLVSDGDAEIADSLATALPVAQAGARLFAVTETVDAGLEGACEHTGGLAHRDPKNVFAALAAVARARADWRAPGTPEPVDQTDPEFEVVIETMEEPR